MSNEIARIFLESDSVFIPTTSLGKIIVANNIVTLLASHYRVFAFQEDTIDYAGPIGMIEQAFSDDLVLASIAENSTIQIDNPQVVKLTMSCFMLRERSIMVIDNISLQDSNGHVVNLERQDSPYADSMILVRLR